MSTIKSLVPSKHALVGGIIVTLITMFLYNRFAPAKLKQIVGPQA